ncbi:sn-1-specific diacylglycerol lipase ABHD11-like [Symsagittifera roscoffensis]|uniref:sn-1-specific diacylglycerol lipase ABHD11-like n=1 Tax=Symsagittifera roscoffensis TaxID=84072 RepID=UPI00307BB565
MKLRTIFNYRKLLCNESKKFIRQSSTLAEAQSEDVIELNAQVHSAKSKVENSPVMVMLHGVFGNSRNFSALSRRIAKQCSIDVHCLDLRNHGDSPHSPSHSQPAMANDVIHYLTNHIYPSKCILLGHSMGGRVAFDAVFNNPDLFCATIIEDSNPFAREMKTLVTTDDINSPFAAIKILKSVDLSYFDGKSVSEVKAEISDVLEDKIPSMAVQAFLLTNLMQSPDKDGVQWRCNVSAIAKYLESYRSSKWDTTFEAYKSRLTKGPIDVPMLCVRGAKSNYILDKDIEQLKHLFSDVSLTTLDTGHWVHSEKPAEFLKEVITFLTLKELISS